MASVSDTDRPPISRTGGSIGILISGRGSNMQALIRAVENGRLDARIAVVISNRPEAPGLELARQAGIETLVVDHRQFTTRHDFDRTLATELKARNVALVCLAGFMRLVGADLLEAFPHGVLNVHPSLLPAFPGVNAQQQALEHGVKVAGATVHLVTPELDGGPIIVQASVPVLPGDTVDSLSARILVEEHRIYPEAVQLVLAGGWRVDGRRFMTVA
jgi:phosphoribosylglycinamide formyltransferase 1